MTEFLCVYFASIVLLALVGRRNKEEAWDLKSLVILVTPVLNTIMAVFVLSAFLYMALSDR